MIDVVCLASGAEFTTRLKLLQERGIRTQALFIDYGQRNKDRELSSLREGARRWAFLEPVVLDVSGYGKIIRTGLTDETKDVYGDAFTPNRNLFFIVLASAYAFTRGVRNVVLGFLSETHCDLPGPD